MIDGLQHVMPKNGGQQNYTSGRKWQILNQKSRFSIRLILLIFGDISE